MLLFQLLILLSIILVITCLKPIDDTSKCVTCQSTVSEWQNNWSNQTTIDATIDALKEECKEKYKIKDILKRKLCDEVVNVLVQIPPSLLDGMNSLAWPIPQALCATIRQCELFCCDDNNLPEQIHLSAETDKTKMTVTWTTLNANSSYVKWGTSSDLLNNIEIGTIDTYTASGWRGSIHSAVMIGLKDKTTYYYQVGNGDDNKWSDIFTFSTFDYSNSINYAIIGDMAYDQYSDNTVKSLINLVNNNKIQAVIHSGDISYADGYDPHFDDFLNKIQPIASKVPYMASPGNHEFWDIFAAYKHRFRMPLFKLTQNMYYNWINGPAHFISLNSETAIDTADFHELEIEYLKKVLSNVDRSVTPFVIVHFHRPMYCSNDDECLTKATKLKNKIEDILFENNVDLVICGHVHVYERTLNVYNNTINSAGPVYIVQGGSGNREGNKGPYPTDLPEWSANQQIVVGYGILTISNEYMDFSFFDSNNQDVALDYVRINKRN